MYNFLRFFFFKEYDIVKKEKRVISKIVVSEIGEGVFLIRLVVVGFCYLFVGCECLVYGVKFF